MTDTELDRRTFLRRASAVPFGAAGWAVQDEPERARYTRRMAFREPETLSDDWRQRPVLLTDRTDDDPDVSDVAGCGFANWPPERLTIWEGIVFDVRNIDDVRRFLGDPAVRAEKQVRRERIFVDEQATPVELGTPYVISGVVECPGGFLGVTATQLSGLRIRTSEGENAN